MAATVLPFAASPGPAGAALAALPGELLHGPAFRLDGLLLAADTVVEALIASDGSDERFAALLFLVDEAREVVEDIIVRLELAGRTAEIAGGG